MWSCLIWIRFFIKHCIGVTSLNCVFIKVLFVGLFGFSFLLSFPFRTRFLVWCCWVCLPTDFFSLIDSGWSVDFFGDCSSGTHLVMMICFSFSPGKAAGWILFLTAGAGRADHDSVLVFSLQNTFLTSEVFSFAENRSSTSQIKTLATSLIPFCE